MARSSKFARVLCAAISIVARQDMARQLLVVSAPIGLLWSTGASAQAIPPSCPANLATWDFGTYEIATQ